MRAQLLKTAGWCYLHSVQ